MDSNDDNVYCLDALTGDFVWSYLTGGDVASSPAVANGVVFVGSFDKNLYALEASSGALLWSYLTLDKVISSPAISDEAVYFGSYDHLVYAVGSSSKSPCYDQSNDLITIILFVVAIVIISIATLVLLRRTR